MLNLNQLRQYAGYVKDEVPAIKRTEMAITKDDLVKMMQEHSVEQNTLMLTLAPEYGVDGVEDSAKWVNTVGFYFLDKTDYSEHDYDAHINIFETTRTTAQAFVSKLINDKIDGGGMFCVFLSWLDESSITVSPVKGLASCNGWYVQISLKSSL